MPTPNEVLVRFRADASDLVSETQKIIAQFRILSEQLQLRGVKGISELGLDKIASEAEAAASRVATLRQQVDLLNQIRQRGEGTRTRIPISPEEQLATGLTPGATGVSRKQIDDAALAAQQELTLLLKNREAIEQRLVEIARLYNVNLDQIIEQSTKRQFIDEKIANIASGQFERDLITERIQALQRVLDQLTAARTEVESQVSQQLGGAKGQKIEKARTDAEERLLQARNRLKESARELAGLEKQASDERIRGTSQQLALEQQILGVQAQRQTFSRQESLAQRDLNKAVAAQDAAIDLTGAREQINEINALIARNQEELFQTLRQGVGAFAPELKGLIQEIGQIQRQEGLTEEERQRKLFDIAQKIYDLKRKAAEVEGAGVSPEVLAQQRIANLPALERTLFTAFDDVGRRFRTALQFALSGAVIFAAQRLVREFFQAAIEVERTFADIESALEFDLADEGLQRGTAGFNKAVEAIRRDVLQLANDFNLLPAEANEAAFKMVARFQDSEDALKAVRAQFLATKISTIDQSEAIRALSAAAEGFATVTLTTNQNLSAQEALLRREQVAADNYAKVLDEAVLIQQRFGVEVEDTLEGTARAAATFAQLGFSVEQTEATIAAVSRTLGQTGVNVAERLNRAFGAITQPETRDKLLELAAASETLNLRLEDFESGAELVRVLDAQFQQLEQREPQTALQLRDIIGQRRETEVVAAFFGTTDLRRAIEASLGGAAGAAERRFSFLAETVSEKIQSVIAQFQSLAQNFERLELFGPIKAFLTFLDLALAGVNELLQGLQSFFQLLDDIGSAIGLNLGEGLKGVLVTAISIYSILRGLTAAVRVIGVAAPKVAGVVAGAGFGGGGAAAGAAVGVLAPAFQNLLRTSREAGNGLKGMTAVAAQLTIAMVAAARATATYVGTALLNVPGVQKFSNALNLTAAGLGGLTLGIAAAALVVANFVSESSKQIQAMRDFQFIPGQAEVAVTEREAAGEAFTPAERDAAKAEEELNRVIASAQENTRGFFNTLTTQLFPVFDETTRNSLGLVEALSRTASGTLGFLVGAGPVTGEDLIPGSEAWWEAQTQAAREAFLQAQLNVVATGIPDLQGEVRTADQRKAVLGLQRGLSQATRDLAAADTAEERDAAAEAVAQLLADYELVTRQIGLTMDGITESTNNLLAKIGEVQRQLQLGRLAEVDAPEAFFGIAEELRNRAAELGQLQSANTPETQEEIDRLLEGADDALIQGIDARIALFERQRARANLIENPTLRLRQVIRSYEQEIEFLRQQGFDEGSTAIQDALQSIAEAYAQLRTEAQDAAVKIARHNVAMARNLADWVRAMERLIDALEDSFPTVTIPGGFGDAGGTVQIQTPEIVAEIESANRDIRDRLNQEAQILAEAQVRLAGPINSELQQIKARIAGLKKKISQGFFSAGEALQAQVELAEAIAQRIEAEAEAAAAYIRLQAGVGDSIRQTQAEITIVTKQLEITASLYGTQSAQYLQLKLAQLNLRNELINAQLELEDLNRRLGSDITNDFEQAQLDLVEIMRQLSQLDLGPLERARLELQKQQAEAAAEAAFFDDRLFQLRFDFETGDIGLSQYIASLKRLLESVDTSTQQGKEIFLEITGLIDSLTGDVADMQFNIPTSIRLPTLFEVRRALAADQLGVNYMDNRTQSLEVNVSSAVDLEDLIRVLDTEFGVSANTEFRRSAPGGSSITPTFFSS